MVGLMIEALPVLFVDHALSDLYRSLLDGRATVVGPDTSDLPLADGVIAGAAKQWNAAAFSEASSKLKVISRTGIGYDNINVPAATAAGVIVCNAPEAPSVSTAEHTLALMLAITKRLPVHIDRANSGLAGEPIAKSLELDGATLGLIGLGRIARRVAVAAQAMGMQIIAHDPYVTDAPSGVTLTTQDDVFERAHIVSLHAPAAAETRHLVNAARLGQMRRGSYLINTARGTLVDQTALVAALDSGHLAGAALDVTDPEPLPIGHPLLGRADAIVTPHVASSTEAGRRRLYEHAIDNALNVLAGRPATIVC
jgi:D-3-phosphoglycerate dehydrogenase / 2-oxoglutarate reductase